ncbi:SUMF1/EgtB/PvdO family nonheme iron enzyme [Ferruginibacter profundus]
MKLKTIITCLTCIAVLQLGANPVDRILVKGGTVLFKGNAVNIKSFQISKYEITNEGYVAFLNSKQIGFDGKYKGIVLINIASKDLQIEFAEKKWRAKHGFENYPMVMVSYYGAAEFCSWMGGSLPGEMEWLYAAQGGVRTKHYRFAGSNNFDEVGWYKNNSSQQVHPVGQKKPNELGIYDMSGNVWEWCMNDMPVNDSSFCVHMGGSWYAGEQPGHLDARYGNTPTHCSNSVGFRIIFTGDTVVVNKNFFKNYPGKPWNNQPQQIPGKIQCEWYDQGGEAIAYHDKDSVNNGNGKLNPANGTFLNEFRMNEGVDISYTKDRDIDNNPYNVKEPEMGSLYAGWMVPGEWINYTVKVNVSGKYSVGMMFTASGDGTIMLLLDGKAITPEVLVPSTRNENETIPWRQWHHWNRIDSLETVTLKKGTHVLTLKTVSNGNMNYDYLDFKLSQ